MRVQRSEPVSRWDLGAHLGEGPAWTRRDAALWFVDIKGCRIHRFDPLSGNRRSWATPNQCGFCLPIASGGFVAGLKTGLHRFDELDGSFVPLLDPEPDRPGNRLNDATVDHHGRLWFGTMDDAEVEATGSIYRLDADGACRAVTPRVSISNGPAISPDGRTLYHVDTLGGTIHACTLHEDGRLSDPRLFAAIPMEEGYPDGPSVDAEGCLWISLYNGWSARRYAPTGELLETVRFPVSAITKIAFGGPDLKTAFATTAAKHLTPEAKAREPQAGDLFSFEVDVPGLPGREVVQGIAGAAG